jgi:hypothetical protein
MRNPSIIVSLIVVAITLPVCTGWGWEGHQIVGRIAEGLISPSVAAKVDAILKNDTCGPYAPCQYGATLSGCAGWADQIKGVSKWRWTSPTHYLNTPDSKDLKSCSYEYARDCKDSTLGPGYCITGAINNVTTQLFHSVNTACALKFLVHYVGDVHQPLHVGFGGDRGGNDETVNWYGQSAGTYPFELHGVWDYDIIEKFQDYEYPEMKNQWESYAAALSKNLTAAQASAWGKCDDSLSSCVDDWARESIAYACSNSYVGADGTTVLAFTKNHSLADPYFYRNIELIHQRLQQGGVRLAAILNTIYK